MKIIGDTTDRIIAQIMALVLREFSIAARVLCTEVSGKAMLYFVPLFLTPFADKLGPALMDNEWPSAPQFLYCALLGTSAGCIGLRAYYDGSYQRNKDDKFNAPPDAPAIKPAATAAQPPTP